MLTSMRALPHRRSVTTTPKPSVKPITCRATSTSAPTVQLDVSAKAPTAPEAPSSTPSSSVRTFVASNIISFVSSFRRTKAVPSAPATVDPVTVPISSAFVDSIPLPPALTERVVGNAASTIPLPPLPPQQPSPPHPTLQLIESRKSQGSKPGHRKDKFKLGLVVEGGGMRGIISGAMLMALQVLGLQDVFDAVYGASAGAINATYFLSGQRHGLDIYAEDLTQGTRFLDFSQLFKGNKPVMNLDYLIDDVMHNVKPLDWDMVLNSPVPLKVVASSLDTLQPVLLTDFADKADLVECLKASASIPELAGPPRVVRGQRLVDAAVFEPVPVQSAIQDGCTHVLVLCTRPAPMKPPPTGWSKEFGKHASRVLRKAVIRADYMREAWQSDLSGPCQDELLASTFGACPLNVQQQLGAYILPIYPATSAGCHPACLDPATLKRGLAEGTRSVEKVFGQPTEEGLERVFGKRVAGAEVVAGKQLAVM